MAAIRITLAVLAAVSLVLKGCDEPPPEGSERVDIQDRSFVLELAADEASIEQGLKYRTEIADDGGMLFVFPRAEVRRFWMHDCLVPIDIIFLDPAGRVTATHQMQVNPRREGETDAQYRQRLRETDMYSSRFAAQFAIELKGGTLDELDIEPDDVIKLDLERLKALAR